MGRAAGRPVRARLPHPGRDGRPRRSPSTRTSSGPATAAPTSAPWRESVASGALDLEELATADPDELPDDEVAARLLALPGVGPYAAAHIMMLIGRYSPLVLDSWTRPKYARVNGRKASDAANRAPLPPLRAVLRGWRSGSTSRVTGSTTSTIREGARRIAPIGAAAAVFGASFAVLSHSGGLRRARAIVMSATTFAGSAQFAAASVLETRRRRGAAVDRGRPAQRAVRTDRRSRSATGCAGARFGRLLEAQLDRGRVVGALAPLRRQLRPRLLIGGGLVLYICWVGGTALGALVGDSARRPGALRPRRSVPGALPRAARPAGDLAPRARRRARRAGRSRWCSSRSSPPACRSSRRRRLASSAGVRA